MCVWGCCSGYCSLAHTGTLCGVSWSRTCNVVVTEFGDKYLPPSHLTSPHFPVFFLPPLPVSSLPSCPCPPPFLLPLFLPPSSHFSSSQGGRYSGDAGRRRHGESEDTRLSQYHDLPSDHLPALQQLNIRLRPHLDSGLNALAVLFSTNNHSFAILYIC